jgi:FkbM family methyltransferase
MSSRDGRLRSLWDTVRLIWSHPLSSRNRSEALERWLRWQVGSRILPGSAIVPFAGSAVLVVQSGLAGATGNIYLGLWEFEEMAFILHCLREGDRFADIGANVGTYTVLASAVCRAESLAIEPVPETFAHLVDNLRVNGIDARVRALQIGIAGRPCVLRFTRSQDAMNHVACDDESDVTEVPVRTLDEVVGERAPLVMKIDVEGFETEVIAGGGRTLQDPELRALIIELNGSGVRYGFDETALRRIIEGAGFRPYDYEPFTRRLTAIDPEGRSGNTLYLRDLPTLEQRIRGASPVRVLGLDL